LLTEWQLTLPLTNELEALNYDRTSSPREGSMEYFKLKLRKSESDGILTDQNLAKHIQFRRKVEFFNTSQELGGAHRPAQRVSGEPLTQATTRDR
jgi:hypothetical protein